MDTYTWSDTYTPDELAAALEVHAAKLAKLQGWYEIAGDLRLAAECVRELSVQVEGYRVAGAELVKQVLAARESFR